MRRLSFLLLVSALVLPTLALGGRSAAGDGSLVVTHVSGTISVQGTGVIFGHFDHGNLTVVEYKADGSTAPTISGATMKATRSYVLYSGSDVRFLFPGGKYTLKFDGAVIDISAVGKGTVKLTSKGSPADASFAVNGAKAVPLTPASATASYGVAAAMTAVSSSRKSS